MNSSASSTTEANAVVAPIHPKAMPVILTSPAEVDRWIEAETGDALALQRPVPDGALSKRSTSAWRCMARSACLVRSLNPSVMHAKTGVGRPRPSC
jgi:putative SOS response-associated peptidase YedK